MNEVLQMLQQIGQKLRRAGCFALGCMLIIVLMLCIVFSALGVALWSALSSH